MRILHTADLHFGHSRFLPEGAHIERQKQMGEEIISVAKTHQVDVVVIAGDITHRPDISPEEEFALIEFLHCLDATVPWVLGDGNHDYLGEGRSRIAFLDLVGFQGCIVTGTPQAQIIAGCNFIVIPYGGYTTEQLEQIVLSFCHSTLPNVVVAHEHFEGAVLDSGFIGKSRSYPKVPNLEQVAYWALGDIHLYQELRKNAIYSGSPIQHTFGEALPKGVVLVELDETLSTTFLPFDLPGKLITLDSPPSEWHEKDFYRIIGKPQILEESPVQLIYTDFAPTVQFNLDPSIILEQISEVLLQVGLPEELLDSALAIHEESFQKVQGNALVTT